MSRLVSTEILKIRSTRTWWAMLIGLVVLTLAFTALGGFTAGQSFAPGAPPTPGPDDPAVARGVYTTGYGMATVFALVLGVLAVSTEYRHQTVTPTFLATPRRSRVVVSKLVAVSAFSALYAVVALVLSAGFGAAIFALRGFEVTLLGDDVPRALALSVVGTVVWGILGTGLATLIRNQIAAIVVGIGVTFILEPLIGLALSLTSWGPDVAKFLPGSASAAVVEVSATGGPLSPDALAWWAGLLVLLAYGSVFAGLGAALTLRRDVT